MNDGVCVSRTMGEQFAFEIPQRHTTRLRMASAQSLSSWGMGHGVGCLMGDGMDDGYVYRMSSCLACLFACHGLSSYDGWIE